MYIVSFIISLKLHYRFHLISLLDLVSYPDSFDILKDEAWYLTHVGSCLVVGVVQELL